MPKAKKVDAKQTTLTSIAKPVRRAEAGGADKLKMGSTASAEYHVASAGSAGAGARPVPKASAMANSTGPDTRKRSVLSSASISMASMYPSRPSNSDSSPAVHVREESRVIPAHSYIIQNPSNGGGLPKPIMEGLISQGIKSSTQAKYIDGLIHDPSDGAMSAEKAPVVAVGSAVGAPEVPKGHSNYYSKPRNPRTRGSPDGTLLPVGQGRA